MRGASFRRDKFAFHSFSLSLPLSILDFVYFGAAVKEARKKVPPSMVWA